MQEVNDVYFPKSKIGFPVFANYLDYIKIFLSLNILFPNDQCVRLSNEKKNNLDYNINCINSICLFQIIAIHDRSLEGIMRTC